MNARKFMFVVTCMAFCILQIRCDIFDSPSEYSGPTLLQFTRSGGIAGIHHVIEIDATGFARLYQDQSGEPVGSYQLSDSEMSTLTGLFGVAHFFDLKSNYEPDNPGADFFIFSITYETRQRSKSVTFHPLADYPSALDVIAAYFVSIEEKITSKEITISDLAPTHIMLDAFTLNSADISGDELTLNVSHSGGCENHAYKLFMSPATFMESFPVQANLYLRHDGKNDPCDALITTDLTFDLQPVAEVYKQGYGTPGQIRFNIYEFYEDEPGKRIEVLYTFD